MSFVRMQTMLMGLSCLGLLVGAMFSPAMGDEEPEGKIIQIGPADPSEVEIKPEGQAAESETQPAPNPYWIGVLGGPVTPELRHHVELPEDEGVLVRDVLPNSPAANAGIETFDILLTANEKPLHNMRDLVDLVRKAGDSQDAIQVEVLRKGELQTVGVTPEERPEEYSAASPQMPGGWGGGLQQGHPGDMGQWLNRQFGQNGPQRFQFRTFGPGFTFPGKQPHIPQLPSGVSVTVRKEGEGPAQITVKRGDEQWEIDASKPEDLEALPEDLRPLAQQMMEGGAMHLDPSQAPGFAPMGPPTDFEGDLQKRIEQMERDMHELQEKLLGPSEESHENET